VSFSQRLPQVKEEGATHWVGRPLARISFVAVLRCLTPPLPAPVQERRIVRSVLGTSVAVLVAVALLASVAAVALHEPRQGEQRSAGRALARPHRPPGPSKFRWRGFCRDCAVRNTSWQVQQSTDESHRCLAHAWILLRTTRRAIPRTGSRRCTFPRSACAPPTEQPPRRL